MMFVVARIEMGRVTRAIRVSKGLIVSIIMRTPIIVQILLMSLPRLSCSVLLMLSVSFVMRLMISP